YAIASSVAGAGFVRAVSLPSTIQYIPPLGNLAAINMTPDETLSAVRDALDAYVDPYLGETLGSAQAVREVRAAGPGFSAQVVLGFPTGGDPAGGGPPRRRPAPAAGG